MRATLVRKDINEMNVTEMYIARESTKSAGLKSAYTKRINAYVKKSKNPIATLRTIKGNATRMTVK